jgi:hypothetical protein
MKLKLKFSRLLEIPSAVMSGERWQIIAFIGFSKFGEKVEQWR